MLALAATGCSGAESSSNEPRSAAQTSVLKETTPSPLPQGSEPVTLDPANFTTDIDNPYWPMPVGARWVFEETDEDGVKQRVEVTVTNRTKTVAAGVEAVVVHDLVTIGGETVEDTLDWYAQDTAGNIWYLGEDTKEYANGKVKTTAGSWEAGVDGAQAGIIMPADPEPGMAYRQEYYEGEAEDNGAIVSTAEMVQVPAGLFRETLMTRDTVPLEPAVQELKFYARGVGPVLTLQTSGGFGREVLIEKTGGTG